jgi:protein-L-isoaspartate(D-aspartate) O-methyltransferase
LTPADTTADSFQQARLRMVEEQIRARGIRDPAVLAAMRTVPRHLCLARSLQDRAYADCALPLGPGQSMSQPYIVALMTELAAVAGKAKVLEIGTGSGYQAAVLAELAGEVYTIELDSVRAGRAADVLEALHYRNVHARRGDGRRGWPEAAPFDAIVVTAGADRAPRVLLAQLAPGGRMVIPVDAGEHQVLRVFERLADDSFREEEITPVRFVPLR